MFGCVERTPGMEEVDEVELVVQRVAALDLGKATLEACMRVPHPSKPGGGCRRSGAMPPPPRRCWRW